MELSHLLALIAGSVFGLMIGYLIRSLFTKKTPGNSVEFERSLAIEQDRAKRLQQDLSQLNNELKAEREKNLKLSGENATLQSNYKNIRERLSEQKTELAELQQQFTNQFKVLANDIFEEKSKKFTDQNKSNLYDILKPLGEKITEFEKKVELTNKESLQRSTALREQIISLRELNQKMTQEAENLTKALKGDTRIQGNWGELVLERILEQSGLEKDREYITQETMHNEDGRRLRPDVIIKLPENRNLVIDAKATLTAYEKYANANTDQERAEYLKAHLITVKAHIKALSEKNYNTLFDGGALDYVLMFIPIEAAFALIVQEGEDLYNEAHNNNIIIVSPATLIATLRTVANIWRHEYQNRNALEIAKQGGALYDKFKAFVDDLVKVGQSLKSTQGTYEEAMKKLYSGRDNLIRKTERLRELGAKTSKTMDQKLLDKADVPNSSQPVNTDSPNLFGD